MKAKINLPVRMYSFISRTSAYACYAHKRECAGTREKSSMQHTPLKKASENVQNNI